MGTKSSHELGGVRELLASGVTGGARPGSEWECCWPGRGLEMGQCQTLLQELGWSKRQWGWPAGCLWVWIKLKHNHQRFCR